MNIIKNYLIYFTALLYFSVANSQNIGFSGSFKNGIQLDLSNQLSIFDSIRSISFSIFTTNGSPNLTWLNANFSVSSKTSTGTFYSGDYMYSTKIEYKIKTNLPVTNKLSLFRISDTNTNNTVTVDNISVELGSARKLSKFRYANRINENCATKKIWVMAKNKILYEKGIFEWPNSPDLHAFNCTSEGVLAIVWDKNKLERTVVDTSKIQPFCKWGRSWTTFGNIVNYYIYYSFDLTQSKDRSDFTTFLQAIENYDYLTLTAVSPISKSNLKFVNTQLSGFGLNLDTNSLVYNNYTLAFVGRKGQNKGECTVQVDTSLSDINSIMVESTLPNATKKISVATCVNETFTATNSSKNIHSNFASIFPNPNSGSIQIIAKNIISSIEIFSFTGAKLQTIQIGESSQTLNLERLNAGQYQIKITDITGNVQVAKFIKL